MSKGTLYIRCIEARCLPIKNSANASISKFPNPYVKFKMGANKCKTKTNQKCINPVWGEDFIIPLDGNTLSMSVWDDNRFAQNEEIGTCEIDLQPIVEKGKEISWYSLTDKSNSLQHAAVLIAIVYEAGVARDVKHCHTILDRATNDYAVAEEKRERPELSLQVVTWNVGNHAPAEDLSELIPKHRLWDFVAVGLQESSYSESSDTIWKEAIAKHLGSEYYNVAAEALWEIGLYVFAHQKHRGVIHSVEKKVESTGVGHILGNKGGVVISLWHNDLSLCFVSSHLAAHMTKKERRNQDVGEIIGGTKMGFKAQTDILNQFHHVFWMGDLNYRIDYGNTELDTPLPEVFEEVVDKIKSNQLAELFVLDQLTKERMAGNVFWGFQEGSMTHFPPTFKVERKEGFSYSAQRCPAWTDRILWKSLSTVPAPRQISLNAAEHVITSDHKPVIGAFEFASYQSPMGYDSSVGECSIVITSLEGKSLRAADVNGFSDPFISFFSPFTEPTKTNVVPKNLNPVWKKEELPTIASFVNSRVKLGQSFIKVVAFDEDLTSANDEIGYGVLYLDQLSVAAPNTDVAFIIQLSFEGRSAGTLSGTFQLQFGAKKPPQKGTLTPSPQSKQPSFRKLPLSFSRRAL